ncbi:SRPBCC family protein [Microbacterium sp. CFBP9034]|uniref:SRPBCC family protein n=1 Tax=Microbacterium sp. CFBP9034 TaxID=3096540 RepID=UPI002A69CFB4|nr:SRPBCC family protein [Microbacterium sp. CFBP9034]MDY0908919.1 SRPBCC family protein [Microbacterium sp. CFBP9034]
MTGAPAPIYVGIRIRASLERVWELTQDPGLHPRWDARFTAITPTGPIAGGGTRFRYELRVLGRTIVGEGTTIGEVSRPDGSRTSALRFATAERLSPLGAGRGYWRYRPDADGVLFSTGYDYAPGWGRAADVVVRPLVGWLTAWSFDRLRIWAEDNVPPERWPVASALMPWRRGRPRASRCVRTAPHGRVMDDAPATLRELAAP